MPLIAERVELARRGANETVICRLPSGWAVMGDVQFLPGYCLLLADPVVASLNDLDDARRAEFLRDMAHLGDAILQVTGSGSTTRSWATPNRSCTRMSSRATRPSRQSFGGCRRGSMTGPPHLATSLRRTLGCAMRCGARCWDRLAPGPLAIAAFSCGRRSSDVIPAPWKLRDLPLRIRLPMLPAVAARRLACLEPADGPLALRAHRLSLLASQ